MAYDEYSFLNGLVLGRAMKGVSMANPNRGNFLRVLSGRLEAARIIPLRPDPASGGDGGTPGLEAWALQISGEHIRPSVVAPGSLGFGGLLTAVTLTQEGQQITASAEAPAGMGSALSAALRQKAADRSLRAPGGPVGLGGTLRAQGTITLEESY
jgi:hypothetical protein